MLSLFSQKEKQDLNCGALQWLNSQCESPHWCSGSVNTLAATEARLQSPPKSVFKVMFLAISKPILCTFPCPLLVWKLKQHMSWATALKMGHSCEDQPEGPSLSSLRGNDASLHLSIWVIGCRVPRPTLQVSLKIWVRLMLSKDTLSEWSISLYLR